MRRVSQPVEPSVTRPPAESTRLLLVPAEATTSEVIYERVAPVVNKMVWLYLATDPDRDDIAQDILMAVVRGAASVRDPAQLEAWVARVAFNTICNLFRRRKLVRWLSLEALSGYDPPAPHVDFDGRELVARTQKILECMPVAERMVLTLQLLGNATVEEIAERCDCSERTARRRLRAARERFTRLVTRDPVLASRLRAHVSPKGDGSDE